MKVLCISDHVDPIVYSNDIRNRFSDISLVISSGDLDTEYYGFIVTSLDIPLAFVFGNHNLREYNDFNGNTYLEQFIAIDDFQHIPMNGNGATYIGGKVKRIKGLIIAGLGGSKRYNRGLNQFSEFGMFLYLLRIIPKLIWNKIVHGKFLDILVTHAPPKGIHDQNDRCHQGFKIFLWFLRIFKPKYLIHGHIHLYDQNAQRITRYHETEVVNAYDHIVLNIEV